MKDKVLVFLGVVECLLAQSNVQGMQGNANSFTIYDSDKSISVSSPDPTKACCSLINAHPNNTDPNKACSFKVLDPRIYIDISKEGYKISSIKFEKNDTFIPQMPMTIELFGSANGLDSTWIRLTGEVEVVYADESIKYKAKNRNQNCEVFRGESKIDWEGRSYQHYYIIVKAEPNRCPAFSKINVVLTKEEK